MTAVHKKKKGEKKGPGHDASLTAYPFAREFTWGERSRATGAGSSSSSSLSRETRRGTEGAESMPPPSLYSPRNSSVFALVNKY